MKAYKDYIADTKVFKAVFEGKIRYFRSFSMEEAKKTAKANKWKITDIREVTGSEGIVKCTVYQTIKGFYVNTGQVDVDKVLAEFPEATYPLAVYTENKPYHLEAEDYYYGQEAIEYFVTEN